MYKKSCTLNGALIDGPNSYRKIHLVGKSFYYGFLIRTWTKRIEGKFIYPSRLLISEKKTEEDTPLTRNFPRLILLNVQRCL